MQALSQLSYSPEFAIRRAIFRSLRQPSGRRPVHPLLGRMNMKWRPLGDSNPCYRRERAVFGVLAASTQGDADAKSLQTGAWVAGNATQSIKGTDLFSLL